jgi:hypothetical protein
MNVPRQENVFYGQAVVVSTYPLWLFCLVCCWPDHVDKSSCGFLRDRGRAVVRAEIHIHISKQGHNKADPSVWVGSVAHQLVERSRQGYSRAMKNDICQDWVATAREEGREHVLEGSAQGLDSSLTCCHARSADFGRGLLLFWTYCCWAGAAGRASASP